MALHSLLTHQRPAARLIPLTALAAFCALLLAGLGALPAQAHSTLLSATPEDGSELDEAPDAVVLTFNEDITDLGTDIVVTGPDGEDATEGETEIDGAEVSRQLAGELAAGEYSITWRAVSADGHPIDVESTFTVLPGAGTGADGEPAEDTGGSTSETGNAENTGSDSGAEAESPGPVPDDATATEDGDAGAEQTGTDGSDGDQADADSSDETDSQADPDASDSEPTSGGQIALFVVIALAVIGGVTAVIVRMRRRQ